LTAQRRKELRAGTRVRSASQRVTIAARLRFTTGSSAPRLKGSQARGPDIREFRHEDSTLDRTGHGSCSRHWQRISGHELCLQIQPSLLVCAVFQHSTPRKSWFVRTDYRISVISDRADACRRRAEDCEHAAPRVTDAQALLCGMATSPSRHAFHRRLAAIEHA
jgi:hypothetical protein